MKLFIGFLSLTTILAFSACSNSTETTTTETPVSTEAATPAPEPAKTSAPAERESTNSTTLGVDKDGVSYSRKSGDNETKVEVTDDSKSVLIKK